MRRDQIADEYHALALINLGDMHGTSGNLAELDSAKHYVEHALVRLGLTQPEEYHLRAQSWSLWGVYAEIVRRYAIRNRDNVSSTVDFSNARDNSNNAYSGLVAMLSNPEVAERDRNELETEVARSRLVRGVIDLSQQVIERRRRLTNFAPRNLLGAVAINEAYARLARHRSQQNASLRVHTALLGIAAEHMGSHKGRGGVWWRRLRQELRWAATHDQNHHAYLQWIALSGVFKLAKLRGAEDLILKGYISEPWPTSNPE